MAETTTLQAQPRTEHGSQAARRIRRQGRIPAVVYGHKEAVTQVTVSHDDMWRVIRASARILTLAVDGKTDNCLVQEVQWDALGKEIQHVDFKRVSADERIHVSVPIQLRGHAPGLNA